MSLIYQFYIPDITCNSCVQSILKALLAEDFQNETNLIIESHHLDHQEKILKIQVKAQDKTARIKKLLMQKIEDTGFSCREVVEDSLVEKEELMQDHSLETRKVTQVSLFEKIYSHHWLLGGIGIGTGIALMIVSMLASGGLSLAVMIAISATSSLLTLALGAPFYYQAIKKLFYNGSMSMDTLFSISTLTVIAVSLASFAFPWLPMMLEAGLLIFGFRHLGLAIEHKLTKSWLSEKKFTDRLPMEVDVLEENSSIKQKLRSIKAGEIIILKPGDVVPIDGEPLNDVLLYDSIITGSFLPSLYKPGRKLYAGMQLTEDSPVAHIKASDAFLSLEAGNVVPVDAVAEEECLIFNEDLNQNITVPKGTTVVANSRMATKAKLKVISVGSYSHLHRLDRNNELAQFEKAPIEEVTTKTLQYFIPAVLLIALFSALIISMFFPLAIAINCAISVLVAACPCTLGLITPLSVKIGIKKAAEQGAQFSSARMLQAANAVNAIVFDLNGTLTTGIPIVKDYAFHPQLTTEEELFSYLAAVEENAPHPVAKAIWEFAVKKNRKPMFIKQSDNSDHSGIRATIRKLDSEQEEEIIIGDQSIMEKYGIDLSLVHEKYKVKAGESLSYIARDGKLLGYTIITDPFRPGALETIELLRKKGIKIFLCTGAHKTTAEAYAAEAKIPLSNVAYGCMGFSENSEDHSKIRFIKQLKDMGYQLAMVGDAANDANAMAATFGIAIRSKSGDEVTQQQASVVIHGDSLLPVVNVFNVAEQTVRNIKQNLGFSLFYNLASVFLASGLLLAFGFTLNPAVGVALMILQTTLILANAYRFKTQPLPLPSLDSSSAVTQESYCCFNRHLNQNSHLNVHVIEKQEENSIRPEFESPTLNYEETETYMPSV
ncbi:heavy metal translocating P-type ATPase [Legionella jordanis]|uniref:Cation transporting ATPase PacS n=1 Tax=Legionella jordanis TaxID=456 RepID=A0A0W0V9G3_9GAMM|nr:HAD-IC family P-type ATPase [Legionella jordanis]KTD16769.1 cation transporting ATPase PacS [Legionella jordanis]RMX03703.1 cation-translocating P-type ATPase [Legionella jordanis]RMX22235.1 cation-translocating P-type ATPase [Legionella jordanis]VEH11763.1 cation transporting ATPase PacS [Legionella jordanis]